MPRLTYPDTLRMFHHERTARTYLRVCSVPVYRWARQHLTPIKRQAATENEHISFPFVATRKWSVQSGLFADSPGDEM